MKILITGGAKSGKSSLAQRIVETVWPGYEWVFVATAQALDEEMTARIARHQSDRGPKWKTLEEPLALAGVASGSRGGRVLLIDCLTLWLSNALAAEDELGWDVAAEIDRLVGAVASTKAEVVMVANEVGLGIVPDNALARRFRDLAGLLNQKMAHIADEVHFVAAGLPLRLK